MSKVAFLGLIFVIAFSTIDCKSPTAPGDNVPPGKSDYVWSIDSLDYGSLPSTIQLKSIWGSSDTDVWGAGFTAEVRDCLWHYNGNDWSRATAGTPITQIGIGSREVGVVWGTSPNDVWAVGGAILSTTPPAEAPFVLHYDGTRWSQVAGDAGSMPLGALDIYGPGDGDDFWVADQGQIVRYNNGTWTSYAIGDSMLVKGITGNSGHVYAIAYAIQTGGNYVALYSFLNNGFQVVDHTTFYNGKFEVGKPWISGGRIYTAWHDVRSAALTSNGGIDTSSWREDLAIPSGYIDGPFFHASKDVWLVGYPNLLYHYDGTSWQAIAITVDGKPVPVGEYSAAWTDGNQISVCDDHNGIIYHGR